MTTTRRAAPMSEAGWAERKVDGYGLLAEETAAAFILAEHRRAVRVVKRELDTCVRQRERETDVMQRDRLGGAMLACSNILAALQKGRT